ncbi:hypothetical protein FM106_08910 [Brachybacterium faecium]|nr:hypothetical protein FM106_08910 [Brachybacterium faecium]
MSVVHGSNRNLRSRRLAVWGLCRSGVDLRGSTGALPASPIMDRALRRRRPRRTAHGHARRTRPRVRPATNGTRKGGCDG